MHIMLPPSAKAVRLSTKYDEENTYADALSEARELSRVYQPQMESAWQDLRRLDPTSESFFDDLAEKKAECIRLIDEIESQKSLLGPFTVLALAIMTKHPDATTAIETARAIVDQTVDGLMARVPLPEGDKQGSGWLSSLWPW